MRRVCFLLQVLKQATWRRYLNCLLTQWRQVPADPAASDAVAVALHPSSPALTWWWNSLAVTAPLARGRSCLALRCWCSRGLSFAASTSACTVTRHPTHRPCQCGGGTDSSSIFESLSRSCQWDT